MITYSQVMQYIFILYEFKILIKYPSDTLTKVVEHNKALQKNRLMPISLDGCYYMKTHLYFRVDLQRVQYDIQ